MCACMCGVLSLPSLLLQQTVDMLSAFKAKLRAAREESRVRADGAAEMEDLGGSDVEEEEGSGWYVVSPDLVILNPV